MDAREVLVRSIAHGQLNAAVTSRGALACASVTLGTQGAALTRRAAALGVMLVELSGAAQVLAAPLRGAVRGEVELNVRRWTEPVPLVGEDLVCLRRVSWVRPSAAERRDMQAQGGEGSWRPSLAVTGERAAVVAVRLAAGRTWVSWTGPGDWSGLWSWWPLPVTVNLLDDQQLERAAVMAGARWCGLQGDTWPWPLE